MKIATQAIIPNGQHWKYSAATTMMQSIIANNNAIIPVPNSLNAGDLRQIFNKFLIFQPTK